MNEPYILCIGGPPGVGKTTLALKLKPLFHKAKLIDPDAILLQVVGKSTDQTVTSEDISPANIAEVISVMETRTQCALDLGFIPIVASSFILEKMRTDFQSMAVARSVGFVGLWLEAGNTMVEERQLKRLADNDPTNKSEVVIRQKREGDLVRGWTTIDASGEPNTIAAQAKQHLGFSWSGLE